MSLNLYFYLFVLSLSLTLLCVLGSGRGRKIKSVEGPEDSFMAWAGGCSAPHFAC
jgi:hypothetical protein